MDPDTWLADSESGPQQPPQPGMKPPGMNQKFAAKRHPAWRTASGRFVARSGSDLPSIDSGRTLGSFQHALMNLEQEHLREIRAVEARCNVQLAAARLEAATDPRRSSQAHLGSGAGVHLLEARQDSDSTHGSNHWAIATPAESEAPSFADFRIGIADNTDNDLGAKAAESQQKTLNAYDAQHPSNGNGTPFQAFQDARGNGCVFPASTHDMVQQRCEIWQRTGMRDLAKAEGWMTQKSQPEATGWRQGITQLVRSMGFDLTSAICILANSILWGLRVNEAAINGNPDDVSDIYVILNKAFVFWFLIEVIIRFLADGRRFFISEESPWNIFDLVVIAIDIAEIVISAGTGDSSEDSPPKVIVRILRVFRFAKSLRILRLFGFARELRMMAFSVVKSIASVVWALVVMFLLIFVFSVFLMQNVTAHLHESRALHTFEEEVNRQVLVEMFGSLMESIYTLFKVASGGVIWGDVGKPLIAIHWANGVVLSLYVFLFLFALANIVTGLFVQMALQSGQIDKDQAIRQQLTFDNSHLSMLRKHLMDFDKEKNGLISYEQFQQLLEDQQVRVHLKSLATDRLEAEGLFQLLDLDCSGIIAVDDFIHGLMRLKGGAMNVDFCTLMHENKRLALKLRSHGSNDATYEGLKQFMLRSNKDQANFLLRNLLANEAEAAGEMTIPWTPRIESPRAPSPRVESPRNDSPRSPPDGGDSDGIKTPPSNVSSPLSPTSL